MKNFISYFLIFCLICLIQNETNSQICEDCICGIYDIQSSGYEPDTIIGGRYKPARSDFNNTVSNSYFPILVVLAESPALL
jgi:hypothetical protein